MVKVEWTPEMLNRLTARYPNERTDNLALEMGLSISALYQKAYAMGLRKSKAFLASPESGIIVKGDTRGMSTRFKKGAIPLNKGKRMSREQYEKCAPTMFKISHKPHNTKFDGCLSLRRDKSGRTYIYIRLAEGKWVLYHRFLWEQHNGNIPTGYNVVFKNGDSSNLAIDNLELVSDSELMARNSYHNYPEDIQQLIQLKGVLQRQINLKLKKDE